LTASLPGHGNATKVRTLSGRSSAPPRCGCPSTTAEDILIRYWVCHGGISTLGAPGGLDPAELEELAKEVRGLSGLAEARVAGVPAVSGSDSRDAEVALTALRACPVHGGQHRWVTRRFGEFELAGSTTSSKVERVEAPLWPLRNSVFRTAIHASRLLLADELTPTVVTDSKTLHDLRDCRGAGEGLQVWVQDPAGGWWKPVEPKLGAIWPEERSRFHGCGHTRVCSYCLTRRRWYQFMSFWLAARRNLRSASRRLSIRAFRLPTAEAKSFVSRARTVSARLTVSGTNRDWVLTVAPAGSLGDVVDDPRTLWKSAFEPDLTRAFAGADGEGWRDERLLAGLRSEEPRGRKRRDFQLKDPIIPSAEAFRETLDAAERVLVDVPSLEKKGQVTLSKTLRQARNRRYQQRRAVAGYLCLEHPFDDVVDVRLGLALDAAELRVGAVGRVHRPRWEGKSQTVATLSPHPSSARTGRLDGIVTRVLPTPVKPGTGLRRWKAAQHSPTGGMPPKPLRVDELPVMLEHGFRASDILLRELRVQTRDDGHQHRFKWSVWRQSLANANKTKPEVFDYALRDLEGRGLAKSSPGGLVELTEGSGPDRYRQRSVVNDVPSARDL
jgi:hypothetical protein